MKPFSQINIGDIYESPSKWAGSQTVYTVVSKDEESKLIEVMSSYQHPSLPSTLWKKSSDRLFSQKLIYNGKTNQVQY